MNIQTVIDQPLSPGIVSIDMAGQVFTHKLRHTPLSPADNAIVLDLASPLYDPGATIDGVSKVYDRSGQGNHGTITGATWKRLPSGLWYLDLDGSSGNVTLGTSPFAQAVFTSGITLETWVNIDTLDGDHQEIFALEGSYTLQVFGITDLIQFKMYDGTDSQTVDSDGVISATAWHHLAATWDATTMRLYIDGVAQAATATQSIGNLDSYARGVRLGSRHDGAAGFFDGGIALARIYTAALSAATAQDHFAQERHLFGV